MTGTLLFVSRKYPPSTGGMQEFAQGLYEALPEPKELLALGRGQAWLPIFLARALLAARRRRGRIERVHLADGLLLPLAPLFARLSAAPVSATVHGLDVTWTAPGYQALVRLSLSDMQGRLVAVSSYTADQVQQRAGFRPTVITNGVDVSRFAAVQRAVDPAAVRADLGLPRSGVMLLTVGRLVRRKGVAWFVETVLPRLGAEVVFAIAGSGPASEEIATAAAGDPRVRLLGRVSDAQVDALMSCADLFVMPNVPVPGDPEGYGIAPAEAATAGLPVLVSGLEGLQDMATDLGLPTVTPGDPEAWTRAVHGALATPDRYMARRPARRWTEVADDYTRFFAGPGAKG